MLTFSCVVWRSVDDGFDTLTKPPSAAPGDKEYPFWTTALDKCLKNAMLEDGPWRH